MAFRQIKHNDSGGSLRSDSFTQLESAFAPHNPAFALKDRDVTNVFNMYAQHDSLPRACSVCSESTRHAINSQPAFCVA
jgi:hypothetical protein